jgi:hypothetical protein
MFIASVVASALVAALFVMSAVPKLAGDARSLQIRDRLRVSPVLWRVIGGLELAGAAGLLVGLAVGALGVAAGLGLTALMVGAVVSHLRVGDRAGVGPAAVGLLMTIAALVLRILSLH